MTVLADCRVAFRQAAEETGQRPLFITLSNNSSNAFIKTSEKTGPALA